MVIRACNPASCLSLMRFICLLVSTLAVRSEVADPSDAFEVAATTFATGEFQSLEVGTLNLHVTAETGFAVDTDGLLFGVESNACAGSLRALEIDPPLRTFSDALFAAERTSSDILFEVELDGTSAIGFEVDRMPRTVVADHAE